MVEIRERVFLISGDNFSQCQQLLQNIKKKILLNNPAALNTVTIYSKEADVKSLQEKIFNVSFAKDKILIFKDFTSLKIKETEFIFANIEKILLSSYIVFETDKSQYYLTKSKKITNNSLFGFILKKARIFRADTFNKKFSIEDFMGSIRKNDLVSSLYILEKMITSGSSDRVLGPQIIGILVGKFSYVNDPVEKSRALNLLWEADRAIKEKGIDTRIAIESLLVKLFNGK